MIIDYNKLKIKHAEILQWLENKIKEQKEHLKLDWVRDDKYTYGHAEGYYMCYRDMYSKMQELTQPKPKYKEGWFRSGNEPRMVKCIANREGYAIHPNEEADVCAEAWGSTIYPTKQTLIEAQINMWQSMLEPKGFQVTADKLQELIREECQHERDEHTYTPGFPYDSKMHYRCKKCGEFYK
jgi:hypothetical protein